MRYQDDEPKVLTGRPLVAWFFGQQEDERGWRLAYRRLYVLVRNHHLPVFRLNGRHLAAKPQALQEWVDARERAGVQPLKAA